MVAIIKVLLFKIPTARGLNDNFFKNHKGKIQ